MKMNHYFAASGAWRPYTHSLPANSGTMPPVTALRGQAPLLVKGFWPCESGGTWVQVKDHRERAAGGAIPPEAAQEATQFWLPGDSFETPGRTMTDIGPLPDGALLQRPAMTDREACALLEREFSAAVQALLDAFARARGYDGIASAVTYAASTDATFRAEGQYALKVRDAAWAKGYEILGAALAGPRPLPGVDEIIAGLPPLAWPEAAA